jgi:N-hydroxyarylamine O-acetyltransferase
MAIDLPAYFERIDYHGPVEPSLAALSEIHWAHLQTVPFENLDIRPLGRRISFDLCALEDKIVRRRRGGFCYELNGLLSEVLRAVGFDVTIVSVRMIQNQGQESPPFDHMALLVRPAEAEERYLVDVGCGRTSPARPLLLSDGHEERQTETACGYRLVLHHDEWQLQLQPHGEPWKPEYDFTVTPCAREDFIDRCRFHDGSPDSPFMQNPICTRNLPGGRITLTDRQLIHTSVGERTEQSIEDEAAFHAALLQHFGVDLSLP